MPKMRHASRTLPSSAARLNSRRRKAYRTSSLTTAPLLVLIASDTTSMGMRRRCLPGGRAPGCRENLETVHASSRGLPGLQRPDAGLGIGRAAVDVGEQRHGALEVLQRLVVATGG